MYKMQSGIHTNTQTIKNSNTRKKNYYQYRYMYLSANGYLMTHKYIDKNTIKLSLIG